MPDMKQSFIKDENGTVYYWNTEINPRKKTLFFLHGLTANHTMFEKQVDFFKDTYNVIVWDAPAHGKSRPYNNFTYGNVAAVLLQILNELQIKEIILIGQSMGGYIAQSFIARYPEKVTGFVSIDSTPFGNYYSKSDIWWLKQIEWMCKPFWEKLLKVSVAKQNAVTKAGRENMLEMVSDYEKEELCHLMGIGYAGFLDDNRELQLSCPALILVGEKDNTGKVKQYNKEWSKRTGIKMTWIPNAAHNSNVDNPEFVNRCMEEFLESITIGEVGGDDIKFTRVVYTRKQRKY